MKTNPHTILSIDERSFYSEVHQDGIKITTVLVAGAVGDYAAYVGHGRPRWTAEHGAKLCFEEARHHFTKLERRKYRR